ncbi:MAG: TetR/AcrR family transcriptional regulator [Pseudomonadota bacterium]
MDNARLYMASEQHNVKGAGRPIQYDRDAALEAAAVLFYEKGFKDTSVQDVVAATGMQTGSVYAAFGSKLSLFLECLERDLEEMRTNVEHFLHDECDPIEGLIGFAAPEVERGGRPCFAMRALVDFPERDSEVWVRISEAWSHRGKAICKAIARGQAAGQVRDDLAPAQIEKRLIAHMVGARFLLQYICEPGECTHLQSREALLDYLRPR